MKSVHRLSEDEIQALVQLHRKCSFENVRSRCQMILLSNEGLTSQTIAIRVGFHQTTVSRFIHRYEAEGLSGLLPKPGSGRPRRATDDYIGKLLETAEKSPGSLGLSISNWTIYNLAEYLISQTGIKLSAKQVGTYLVANGWYLERPGMIVKRKQDSIR